MIFVILGIIVLIVSFAIALISLIREQKRERVSDEVDIKPKVENLPIQEEKLQHAPATLEEPKESPKFPWEDVSPDVSFDIGNIKEEQMKKKLGGVISLSDLTKDKT